MIRSGYLQITPVKSGHIDPHDALHGYKNGLFPMGANRDEDLYAWFTHVPRGVLPLDALHISKSLKKELKKQRFKITCDEVFERVIDKCATGRDGDIESATWISDPIRTLFLELHDLGYAHSIECWDKNNLIGGLYGLHIGSAFFGESMFSRKSNASKIALVYLVNHLNQQKFHLLDTQQTTPHTETMGVIEIQELDYLWALKNAVNQDVRWGRFLPHILEI